MVKHRRCAIWDDEAFWNSDKIAKIHQALTPDVVIAHVSKEQSSAALHPGDTLKRYVVHHLSAYPQLSSQE